MIGVELTPDRPHGEAVALGEIAADAGVDAVFCSAHYNNRDPFQVLSALAARTDDVALGPGVANPHETHPVALASKVATLDEVSGGRAVFGIGPGDPSTVRNIGVDDDDRSLRGVLEAFEAARDLWDGKRIDHDGSFAADDAGLNYTPPQGRSIPVHVGGEGPHMCRMAAKRADGLLFNGSHPDDLAWAADRVAEGIDARPAEDGGREAFEFAAYASVSVADDAEAARAAARPPVAFVAAGAAPPVLQRHGIDLDRAAAIGDHIAAGEFDAAFDAVTPAMIDAFCAAGTPETVERRLAALLDHADGVVLGSPLGPEPETAIRLAVRAAADAGASDR